MKNQLILFTSDFPYGTGETFLETEIVYLAKGFDEVKIISQNTSSNECRSLPDNCSVERIDLSISSFDIIKALLGVLSPLFWKERKVIKSVYKKQFTKGIVSTMLISLYRASKVKKYVSNIQEANKQNDQLYFYSYWCDDVALGLAMAQVEFPKIKTLCRAHGWDVYFEASSINYLPFRQFIADNLRKIFAISDKGKGYMKERWKVINDENICVSRLGVAKQEMLAPNSDKFIVVSCSNVIPLKRVALIVRALAEIKDHEISWVHFGDGPLLEEVKTLAKEILPKNIDVEFKGRLSNQEVLNWYAENNPSLFINVSTTEGIPVSIMEAMSFGIPVIATNVGGTSEIVNEENLLFKNPTSKDIVDFMRFFYDLTFDEKYNHSLDAIKIWDEKFNATANYSLFVNHITML